LREESAHCPARGDVRFGFISRHSRRKKSCPLYPRKRTCAVQLGPLWAKSGHRSVGLTLGLMAACPAGTLPKLIPTKRGHREESARPEPPNSRRSLERQCLVESATNKLTQYHKYGVPNLLAN